MQEVRHINKHLLNHAEEEQLDEEISNIMSDMNRLQASIVQNEHLNRLLQVDNEWLAQREP